MSNINNQHQATIKADLGGGGGLRGSTAVPRPLPAPSPPLMPSGAQGVSASTGGDAHRGGGLPGTSTSTPLTPPTPPTPTPPTSSPSIPLTLPVPSPPLIPSVVQGGSASRGGGHSRGRGPAWFLLPPTFLPYQLPHPTPFFPSSYSSSTSSFIFSSSPFNRGFQTTGCSRGLSSASEGLSQSPLLPWRA